MAGALNGEGEDPAVLFGMRPAAQATREDVEAMLIRRGWDAPHAIA